MERKYELTVVFSVDTQADGSSQSLEASSLKLVDAEIEAVAGKVERSFVHGQRTLAYPIKKQKNGFYITFWLNLDTTKVAHFEQELSRHSEVLRHLLVEELRFSEQQLTAQTERETEEGEPTRSTMTELPPTVATTNSRRTDKSEPAVIEEPVDEGERQKKLDEKLEELLKE